MIEDEKRGADVPRKNEVVIHQLAGRLFTKRVVNAEAVACTNLYGNTLANSRLGTLGGIFYSLNLRIIWTLKGC